MKLHRTSGNPDWATIETSDYNIWQRIASATGGIVTIGNILTIIGFAIVLYGLVAIIDQHYWTGGIALALGRLCDLADGWLADMTGTKSPIGEMLDATVDKISTILTVLVFFSAQAAPWWALTALVAPHVIIALVIAIKRAQHIKVHPSQIGKLSMAAAWLGLLGLVAIDALAASWTHPVTIISYILVITSFISGSYVAAEYARQRA